MCLKQSFFHSKWVFQAILSLTVFSNYISGSSNFDTGFSLTVPNCVVFFLGYWIGNLMDVPKMWLKQLISYSKWVLKVILSLTVLSNYISSSSNFDIVFSLTVPNLVVFF